MFPDYSTIGGFYLNWSTNNRILVLVLLSCFGKFCVVIYAYVRYENYLSIYYSQTTLLNVYTYRLFVILKHQ